MYIYFNYSGIVLCLCSVHSLADPNYEEETLCGAVLIVTATEDGSLFGCNKSGMIHCADVLVVLV